MYDKRIIRGNTYASMVVPAASANEPKQRTKMMMPSGEKPGPQAVFLELLTSISLEKKKQPNLKN